MQHPFATLTHTREPLTQADRDTLATTRRAAVIGGGVLGVVAVAGLGGAISELPTIVAVVFAVPLLGMLAIAIWLVRRTSADQRATHKLVFSGTITGKRAERVNDAPVQGQMATPEVRHVLALDGVDFKVSTYMFGEVEEGHRAEIHCLREGEAFRVVRA